MRSHFLRNAFIKPSAPTLSVEEEAIIADEINQHMTDVVDAANDNERLGDIIVSMGDVDTVVSNTPEIGNVEQSLISSVADMAVAGTDADAEDVSKEVMPLPAGMASEGVADTVKDTLMKIWETIKASLIKVWDLIKSFFQKVQQFLTGTKRRAEALKKLLAQHSGVSLANNTDSKFNGAAGFLIKAGKPTTQVGKDLGEALDWSEEVIETIAMDGEMAIDGGVKLLDSYIRSSKSTDNNGHAFDTDLRKPFERMAQVTKLKATTNVGKSGGGSSLHSAGVYPLGNLEFTGFLPGAWSFENDDANRILNDISSWLKLSVASPDGASNKPVPLTNDMSQIKLALKHSEDFLKFVEQKSGIIAKMSDHAKAAQGKITQLVKTVDEQGNENDPVKVKGNVKLILKINSQISNMLAMVTQKVVAHNTKLTNAALDYCIQSLQAGTKAASPKS